VSTDFYSFESFNNSASGESSYHTCNEGEDAPPKFTKVLDSLTVLEGETATLEVRVTGSPRPMVLWYKGEHHTMIKDSAEHVTLEEENNVYKLVIRVG
jgi:hypothetical protein